MHYTGGLAFDIVECAEQVCVSHMAVTEHMLNPFGTVHAGALLWLADVTATALALGCEAPVEGGAGFPLAINLHASLLGNVRAGEVRAEARFVRKGKRVSVVRTQVTGAEGQLLVEVTTTHVPAR
jgi:1,4-dihydroxy-2-naphthoyl-CoA hydrolase